MGYIQVAKYVFKPDLDWIRRLGYLVWNEFKYLGSWLSLRMSKVKLVDSLLNYHFPKKVIFFK